MIKRHVWNNYHKKIFLELIKGFNESNIRFFILRNYKRLPDDNSSKDIDFVIDPINFDLAYSVLLKVMREFKIKNYYTRNFGVVKSTYLIDLDNDFAIEFDLLKGFVVAGHEPFDFDFLYSKTINYKQFKVLQKSIEVTLLFIYKILSWRKIKQNYKNEIKDVLDNDIESFKFYLSRVFGDKKSHTIISLLIVGDYDNIIKNAKIYLLAFKIKSFVRSPLNTSKRICQFILNRIQNNFKSSKFISVLGADGSGKTTFIENLTKLIAFYYVDDISKSNVYHHRPKILPNLGAAGEKVGVMKQDVDFTNPHRAKPANFISSLIRMTYYWLDYFLGVPIKLQNDNRFDKFTIYDRYIYDFLIDPNRSRINLPYWLRKLYTKLVIQPRIVFVLLTDAEIIYNRKQELSIREINRQLYEFKKLAASHERFIVLDASEAPEELARDAIKIIVKHFTKKNIH